MLGVDLLFLLFCFLPCFSMCFVWVLRKARGWQLCSSCLASQGSKLGLPESTLRQRIEEADPVEPDPGSPAPEHPDPAVDPDPVDPPVAPEAPEEDPEHAVALGKLVEVEEMLAQASCMRPGRKALVSCRRVA